MSRKTEEEKFLIEAYGVAKNDGDLSSEINALEVGKKIGQHDRKIKNIAKTLSRSGFIKKRGENNFILTQKGISLVEDIRS